MSIKRKLLGCLRCAGMLLLAASITLPLVPISTTSADGSNLLPINVVPPVQQSQDSEIIVLRQENSKTYDLGNGQRSIEVSVGAIHYKDTEGKWQEIDTNCAEVDSGNFTARFTKLPYVIRMGNDGRRRIYPDRNDLSYWIEMGKPFASMGVPIKVGGYWVWNFTNAIIAIKVENQAVRFDFRLKNANAPSSITIPFTVEGITRIGSLLYHNGKVVGELQKPFARDAKGIERDCQVSWETGSVTLSLDTVGLTYPIDVDPTWIVGASTDDCRRWYSAGGNWSTITDNNPAGYGNAAIQDFGSAFRFLNVTIPVGSNITSASVNLTCQASIADVVVNTRLRAEANINPLTFSTSADFDARTWTDATHVHWDAIPAWVLDTEYTSPDISACIQEVIDLPGWASGDNLSILWDDFEMRSDAVDGHYRIAYSWDGDTTKAPKLVVTYNAPPEVTTNAASNISTNSAQGNGNVTAIHDTNITERGFVWDTATHGDPGDTAANATAYADYWTEVGSWGIGTFNSGTGNITGLNAGTLYYMRACAKNDANRWAYGAEVTFTTILSITTFMVEGTGRDWAILRGYIANSGSSNVTTIKVEWGLTTGVYTNNATATGIWDTGDYFTLTARNLQPATVYYWRAGGLVVGGVYCYGSELTFATEGSPSLREYWNTGGDNSSSNITGSEWRAEQFTTTALGHSVTSIRLCLQRYGNPGTIIASLREATAGVPTGLDEINDIVTTVTFNGNTLSTSDWLWAEFKITEIYLQGSKQYAVVLRSLAGDATNFVRWRMDTSGDGIAATTGDNSTDGGLTWSIDTSDYLFEIWGNEALEVKSAKVFGHYFETGDLLFTVDMFNSYPPYYPADDSKEYFDLRLYDTLGTTIIASTPCVDWGRRAGSIYLSADAATPLTLGSGYYLRLIGSFDPTNVIASYQLVAGDWKGDDLALLDSWVITEAHLMEIADGVAYGTYVKSVEGMEKLDNISGVRMDKGISGLSYVRPDLFQIVHHQLKYTSSTYTNAFEGVTTWQTQLGADVHATMDSIGALVTVDGKVILQILLVGAMITLALVTRSFFFGLVLAAPIAYWGTSLRVIPIQVMAVLAALAALIFVYKVWFSRG